MKVKTDLVVTAYRLINSAKLSKMEDADKFSIIKIAKEFKKTANDFEDYLKDAQEKLRPDGFDAIARKVQSKELLTEAETATLNKYNQDVTNCVNDELEKIADLDFEPLSKDALGRFVASNDFTINDILIISDAIGG